MSSIFKSGSFFVGCNYWASNAGMHMWREWDEDVVAKDMEDMARDGLQVLRVFPLWSDFQPINLLTIAGGGNAEVRFGEKKLPNTETGRAGMSEEALDRFEIMADNAHKNGLQLVVGLITGWMSGRLFVPPALEQRNLFTDPFALRWQVRFIRHFVKRFKNHPAIVAWDLGNECNCLSKAGNSDEAYSWTALISNTIRMSDPSLPIVSGMHSLSPADDATWKIQDQAELTDVLTTHPYPVFTPYCQNDHILTIRSLLHATAESRFYSDIGGVPCFAEEVGTLGPAIASDLTTAKYTRNILFSLWAHDCRGMLWWCGFDQNHLDNAPYEWLSCERELGLYKNDRSKKQVIDEISKFSQLIKDMPFEKLPARKADAICVLSKCQDHWGVAYSAFTLATQAGFDIEFQFADQPIKDAELYMLPSVDSSFAIPKSQWLKLLEKVWNGATLYASVGARGLQPMEQFGFAIESQYRRTSDATVILKDETKDIITAPAEFRFKLAVNNAEVLASEPDGNAVFTEAKYGSGKLYFLGIPLEQSICQLNDAFGKENSQSFYKIYKTFAKETILNRVVHTDVPDVGITLHVQNNNIICVMINYSPNDINVPLVVKADYRIGEVLYGNPLQNLQAAIKANDAVIFKCKKMD
jgi:endo-1,4-beta-mannosidase